jgi:hypothetical protein
MDAEISSLVPAVWLLVTLGRGEQETKGRPHCGAPLMEVQMRPTGFGSSQCRAHLAHVSDTSLAPAAACGLFRICAIQRHTNC